MIHIFIRSFIFCCFEKTFLIDGLFLDLEYEDFDNFFTTKCYYWPFIVICFTFQVRKIVVENNLFLLDFMSFKEFEIIDVKIGFKLD